MKKAFSSGYSGGSGCVGLVVKTAFCAERLNASIAEGRRTDTSVIRPSLWTLNVSTTCPRIDIAA